MLQNHYDHYTFYPENSQKLYPSVTFQLFQHESNVLPNVLIVHKVTKFKMRMDIQYDHIIIYPFRYQHDACGSFAFIGRMVAKTMLIEKISIKTRPIYIIHLRYICSYVYYQVEVENCWKASVVAHLMFNQQPNRSQIYTIAYY